MLKFTHVLYVEMCIHANISFKVNTDITNSQCFPIFQGDGAGKDVLTGLSNGMDRHRSKDKVCLNIAAIVINSH